MFWREFYLASSISSTTDEEKAEKDRIWHETARKLTWHNQLDLADFYEKHTIAIEQKASAWFHVTYHESKRKKKNRDMRSKREKFYSFAWLVYPVLFHLYDHPRKETSSDAVHDKRKRKRRHQRRNKGKH